MKKSLATAALWLAGALIAPRAAAAVELTLTEVSGAPSTEATVTVSLKSDVPVAALQLSASLGDAATAVPGSAAASGRAQGHSAQCGTREGVTTLMLYSTGMAEIAPGNGEVAQFDVRLGTSPMAVSPVVTVKATDASGNEIACTAATMTVKVEGATAAYPGGPAFSYGRVPIRGTYTLSVPVQNTGSTPLIISNVGFSSADFACASRMPLTVGAGAQASIDVCYSPAERGEVSATMTVECNSSRPDNTLRLLAQPFAVNEVHVGNAQGVTDTEVTVPVSMNNMDDITGFTLEFDLPPHLEYVEGSFRLSERSADHFAVATCVGGKLRATVYSNTDTPFRGNEGVIASFGVTPSGYNSVDLAPSKAVLAAVIGGNVTDVTSAVYPGRVSVLYPQIDMSSSLDMGRTAVTSDVTRTITVRNRGTSTLTVDRIMADGIDVACDCVLPLVIEAGKSTNIGVTLSGTAEGKIGGTLQFYSDDPAQRLVNMAVSAERYAPNSFRFDGGEGEISTQSCMLELALDNYNGISGIQFDLAVPAGFEPQQIESTGRASGFSATFNRINASTVRYFIYSLNGGEIAPGNDVVVRLPFSYPAGTRAGIYAFTASAVTLGDANLANRSSVTELIPGAIELYLLGDLNNDGEIDVADYQAMINHIARPATSNVRLKIADMNADSEIDVADLQILLRKIAIKQ